MIDFFKESKFFSFEEQLIMNNLAVDVTKDEFLMQLDFSISVCGKDDDFSLELMQNIKSKVLKLSDEEWKQLQEFIPFPVDDSMEEYIEE